MVAGALRSGGPAGPVGAPDLSSLSCADLDAAIAHVGALGVKSQDAAIALASAVLVKHLCGAVHLGDSLLSLPVRRC